MYTPKNAYQYTARVHWYTVRKCSFATSLQHCPYGSPCIRRDKLNSQFIVTKFSILHAGGRSLFRFQTSREAKSSSRSPEPHPLIRALEMVECGPRYCIFTVLDLKSEKFWENLKIHAGGDDKLRIQFAPPKVLFSLLLCVVVQCSVGH